MIMRLVYVPMVMVPRVFSGPLGCQRPWYLARRYGEVEIHKDRTQGATAVQMQGMRAVLEVNSMGRLSRIYGTTVAVAAIEAIKLLERLKVDDFIRVT